MDLALGRSLRLAGGDGEVQRKPLDSLGMHLLFKGLEGFSETDLADGVSANFTTAHTIRAVLPAGFQAET